MLSVGVLDLLPEALELVQDPHIVLTWFLVGIVGFFLLERFLFWHHHHEGQEKPVIKMVIIGDSLHNLLDGVAIASSFVISPALGMSTTLAIIAHEIPQEISDFDYFFISLGVRERRFFQLRFRFICYSWCTFSLLPWEYCFKLRIYSACCDWRNVCVHLMCRSDSRAS